MLKATVYRIGNSLYPSDTTSLNVFNQIKENEPYMIKIWKPRNIKLHNLYFALLKLFVHNTSIEDFQPKDDTPAAEQHAIDTFRKAVQIYIGSYEIITGVDGKTEYIVPKSISFETMDEEEFRATIFNPTLEIISKMLNVEKEELLSMLGDYI